VHEQRSAGLGAFRVDEGVVDDVGQLLAERVSVHRNAAGVAGTAAPLIPRLGGNLRGEHEQNHQEPGHEKSLALPMRCLDSNA